MGPPGWWLGQVSWEGAAWLIFAWQGRFWMPWMIDTPLGFYINDLHNTIGSTRRGSGKPRKVKGERATGAEAAMRLSFDPSSARLDEEPSHTGTAAREMLM